MGKKLFLSLLQALFLVENNWNLQVVKLGVVDNFNCVYMKVCEKYMKLHDKIKNIKTAMLTLADRSSCLYSLPLYTVMTECEGHIWFFIKLDLDMQNDLAHHPCVNLSYSNPDSRIFVSISGKGEVIGDLDKIKELWKPVFSEWFPLGLQDPELVLLKVNMKEAQYWDVNIAEMRNLWDHSESILVETQNDFIDPVVDGEVN
jgi:general stress protein 26